MYRHFRITNWLVALATFGLGVLISSSFVSESVPSTSVESVPSTSYEKVVVRDESKPCVRYILCFERRNLLEGRFHETEHRLVEVVRRSGVYSRRSEKQLESLQLQLKDELRILGARRDNLIQREVDRQRRHAELDQREICNEH